MIRVVPASQAKNNFGEVIRRVYEKDELQVIERDGLPVAAIVSIEDLERLYPEKVKGLPRVAASSKRLQATQRLMASLDRMQAGNEQYSDDEVEADVLQAVAEVRQRKSAKR